MEKKSPDAFRTISEVAEWLGVPTHVLRFWESRFSQVKPVKRAGGRRYYRPNDMALLGGIRKLLHEDGMTIRGVQKLLREEGVKHVAALSPPLDSTTMRDVTPSNVVPLAGKPAQDDAVDTTVNQAKDTAEEASQADDATPPANDAAKSDLEPAQPAMSFTRADADAHAATDSPQDDKTDDVPASAPATPTPSFGSNRVAASAQSTDQTDQADGTKSTVPTPAARADQPDADAPAPTPRPDISHISADPPDDIASARPAFATLLRHARKAGTDTHIPALQALADRLETLGQQMAERAGQSH